MADVNANIGVHIDTSAALAELKNLQRQLATFHQSVSKGSAASALAQKNLQTNLLNAINATGQFSAQMGLVRTSTESFTHALEKNKLGMREYFRYAGGATKTFGRLFKQEFDTINKVAEDRVKKMQTQYIKMGRDANGAMKAMAIKPTTLNMKDLATQTALAAQKQALFNQLVKQGSTNLLNFGKNTQWAGRQLMVGFTVPLAYLGTAAAKTFMDLEKQALKFKRVYGDMFTTSEETNKALDEIQKLAQSFTKYGVAVVDTMEMAASAAAMGKKGADLTAQVAEATRLAVLGGVEQQQALETTISLTNAFGIEAEDLSKKIDFLNSVENQTVVSIEDLTIAIPKAGPVIQQLGGDVEDLAFFLTAMKEGGINASEGANALKSGLASLINPSKKSAAMLNTLGVNINAIVETNKGNVRQTVIDFSRALDTLDPLNRARAIEQLFGKFQFSRLSTLFQNVSKDGTQAAKVLGLASASVEELAILAERELKTVEDAVGTNFKAAVQDLKLTLAPIGKEFLKAVTPIVKVVGDILEKFNGLSDGTKKFIVIATSLVGIIGPTLLMTFGLLANGAANIIKLFLSLRTGFLRLGGNSKILAEQTSYMTSEQLEAATVATSLNQAHTRLTQSFSAEATAVRALRQAYVDATRAAAQFAMANPGMMTTGGKGIKPGKNNLGQKPKGFTTGTTGLPGPKGAGDIIPILAAPGEAIIPANVAQDPKFQPIISAMVNGTLQGFIDGTDDLQPFANSPKFKGKVDYSGPSGQVLDINPSQINDLRAGRPRTKETNEEFAIRSAAEAERVQRRLALMKAREAGTDLEFEGKIYDAQTARRKKDVKAFLDSLIKNNNDSYTYIDKKTGTGTNIPLDKLHYALNKRSAQGEEFTPTKILRVLGVGSGARGTSVGTSRPAWIGELMKEAKSNPNALAEAEAVKEELAKRGIKNLKQSQLDNLFGLQASHIIEERNADGSKIWRAANVAPEPGYLNNYLNTVKGNLGTDLLAMSDSQLKSLGIDRAELQLLTSGVHPTNGKAADTLKAIADYQIKKTPNLDTIYQAHAVSAGVEYRQKNNIYDGGIKTLAQLFPQNKKVMEELGLTPAKKTTSKQVKLEKAASAESAGDRAAREARLEEVAARTKSSPVANEKPEQYTRQLTKSSGYSFSPSPGIAGLYEKPNGTKVFVKPVMDYASAIAEQRGTIIARNVHGLEAPEQTVKTMIDPTDETGQRKLIILESPYDERFDERKMSRTFTQDEYIKQLLASSLRGDKDLKAGNLGGSVVADVGPAGVFNKASGLRDYSTNMPSVFEMMQTNVREVPGKTAGNSPFWFSNTTADVARNMTADEFASKMNAEVDRTTKTLESTIKGFNLIDPPASDNSPQANAMRAEKKAYELMLKRLKDAKGQNWKEIHRLHTSIAVKPDELLQDDKTGELEKPKTKPKPSGVKSTGGSKDTRTTKEPKGKSVVQRPRNYRMRGMADAPEAYDPRKGPKPKTGGSATDMLWQDADRRAAENKAKAEERKAKREAQRAADKAAAERAAARKTRSPGIKIIDAEAQFRAEQKSLRRQLEKLERMKVVQTKKEIKQQQRQSEIRQNLQKEQDENIKKTIKAEEETRAQKAQDKKMQKQQSRMMKMQGVGMAAGMASTGAYMTGNTNIGHALMAISALASLGPMIATPMGIFATTLVAAGAAALKFNHDVEKARKEGVELAKSMTMTSEKLQSLAKITGTVSATELANKKRETTLSGEDAVQRKFGQNILGSDFGKTLMADIEAQTKSGRSITQIGENVSNSLAYAVVQGVITGDQAKSISSALGEELKSYEIPAIISGRLVNLLGPNGENLEKSPLRVAIEIQKKSMETQAEAFQSAINNRKDTRTVGGGLMLAGGAAAGLGALAATGVGVPIAALASIAMIGKSLYDQNKIKAANMKLDAAATEMGIQQIVMNNGLVDSLNKQFDEKLKTAKTEAEIKTIEDKRAKALEIINNKNSSALDLLIEQKDQLSNGAFTKGINSAIDSLYKDGPMKAFADQAKAMLSQGKSSTFKTMLQIELASGGLDPLTVIKLVNNPNLEGKYDLTVSAQGTKDTNMLFQLLMKAGIEDQNLPVMLDVFAKDPVNFDKNIKALSTLANMQQKYGITIDLNDDGVNQVKEVADITDKLSKLTGDELTKEVFFGLGFTGDMTPEQMDKLWTTLVGTSSTINKKVVVDFVAAGDKNVLSAYLSEKGITQLRGRSAAGQSKAYSDDAAAWLVGRQGKNVDGKIPGGVGGGGSGGKRDTTFDDLLNDLKRTRDATIDAAGGSKELLRILSGKKDITIFNGIDQQLSKIGANSDFIDWIGGIDDAIRNKLITVTKKGVVALTELGNAAKKAFDEKQLGLFSAGAQDQINTAKAQRDAFLKLSNAGLATSDVLKLIEEGGLANAIANAKNAEEIKKVVRQEKAKKEQMELTSAMTDPKTFLQDINAELDRQYNYQKKLMDLEKSKTEAKISGDYIGSAIFKQQQSYETSAFGRDSVDLTGKMATMQQAMGLLGGIKDNAQRAQLQSTLGQGMLGLQQLGSFSPTFGNATQFAGISPYSGLSLGTSGAANSSSSVYNIQMTVNGNNATSDDIANQVIKKINLVAQKNNKTNAVGK